MKIVVMPKSISGQWSIRFIIFFFLFLLIFFLFVASGERGGETFFSNLLLTVPFLLATISGIGAFFTGIISIIKNKERSVSVFISTGIGFLVLLWSIAEILFPHWNKFGKIRFNDFEVSWTLIVIVFSVGFWEGNACAIQGFTLD